VALMVARQAAAEGGAMVILDHQPAERQFSREFYQREFYQREFYQREFYPPGAAALGIDLRRVLVIRTDQQGEQLWVLDQCLRCSAVAAVWAHVERLSQRDFRRLQLASEEGGGLGLLIRPSLVRRQPSWSDVQLLVHVVAGGSRDLRTGRRVRIQVTRCRRRSPCDSASSTVELEISDVTGQMRVIEETRAPDVVRPAEDRHETRVVHSAAELVDPASGCRSARA